MLSCQMIICCVFWCFCPFCWSTSTSGSRPVVSCAESVRDPYTCREGFKLTSTSTIPQEKPSYSFDIDMILRTISSAHQALLQQVCFDQWHLQKCHRCLCAIEIISSPPDLEVFGKFVFELVSPLAVHFIYEFYNNVFVVFLQKHLRLLSECDRTFGACRTRS